MATRTLIDGATNLTLTASWSGSTVPVTDDDIVIPRGTQHIDTFNFAAVRAESLKIAFSGRIETAAGAAMAIDVDATSDAFAEIVGANARLKLAGGSTNGVWITTTMNSPGTLATFTGGTWTNFRHENGTAVFDGTGVVTNIWIWGGSVTLGEMSTAVTAGNIWGGSVTINRPGTYNIYGGSVTLDVQVSGTTTINLHGGVLVHVNGDFGGQLMRGTYVDKLEDDATIDGVTIGPSPGMKIHAGRVVFANVTTLGIDKSAHPGL